MTDTELSGEDAARIADAVEDIEQTISRLRDQQDISRAEYRADERRELREATERKFEKLTAATIDIAETILSVERESIPEHRKAVFTELADAGLIGERLAQKLREAVGFRDVLAHTYGPIVNDDIVYRQFESSASGSSPESEADNA